MEGDNSVKSCMKLLSMLVGLSILSGCAGPDEVKKPVKKVEAMLRVAKQARKTGNPDASISFYNKALELSSNNPEALLGLAENYIDNNLLDAALVYISKAEKQNCDKSHSNYLRGKIALINNRIVEAEKYFKLSNSIDAINALGTMYDERGDHRKAQEMYKKVIAMDPNYIDAYNNLGLSLLLTERYKEAIFYLENACSLPEANEAYRGNLALAYGMIGEIDKARMVYSQDFEGNVLEEKIGYLEDLLAARQLRRSRRQEYKKETVSKSSKKAKSGPHFFRNRNKKDSV